MTSRWVWHLSDHVSRNKPFWRRTNTWTAVKKRWAVWERGKWECFDPEDNASLAPATTGEYFLFKDKLFEVFSFQSHPESIRRKTSHQLCLTSLRPTAVFSFSIDSASVRALSAHEWQIVQLFTFFYTFLLLYQVVTAYEFVNDCWYNVSINSMGLWVLHIIFSLSLQRNYGYTIKGVLVTMQLYLSTV